MPQRNPGILDGNAFKMGLFGSNCSGGLSFTTLPERWEASWDNNVKLARLADEAGVECMVPIARWKGFGGATDVNGTSFETITWACGLLAQTRRISVFGTVHVPMIHPVLAAKQMVTADHVGHGRFGLNIVCGFNRNEFQMFGVPQYEHDVRYEQGQEWWEVVKKVWSCAGPCTHDGKFYKLSALEGLPGPYGGKNPVMMNAGVSPAGRGFAIRNSDLHFDDLHFGNCAHPEEASDRIKETKRLARELGREIQVWIPVSVVCRPSQKEVDEYLRRSVEHADWEASGTLDAPACRTFQCACPLNRSNEAKNPERSQSSGIRRKLFHLWRAGSRCARVEPLPHSRLRRRRDRLHQLFGGAALFRAGSDSPSGADGNPQARVEQASLHPSV